MIELEYLASALPKDARAAALTKESVRVRQSTLAELLAGCVPPDRLSSIQTAITWYCFAEIADAMAELGLIHAVERDGSTGEFKQVEAQSTRH